MTETNKGRSQDVGRIRGCLLGGAVGDALGSPVEFMSLERIRRRYGAGGITRYDVAYGRRGALTDDTQMTLFTAEGALRAIARLSTKGIVHGPSVLHHAYLRWLYTQGERSTHPRFQPPFDGWLVALPELHERRAPGTTCLTALRGDTFGTPEAPLNDSKGCGGVMRMAPIGLLLEPEAAFKTGCEAAALTHGHPSGYLTAGVLAALTARLLAGEDLEAAARAELARVREEAGGEETVRAMAQALQAAAEGAPSAERVERLGAGWVAEEALAIGLYAALAAGCDFARGVRLAVNHSGDSDSTGAIAGGLLGAWLGASAIPDEYLEELELREAIESLAADVATRYEESAAWLTRYPPW